MYPWLVPGVTQAPEAPPPRILTDRGWVNLFPMSVYSNKRARLEALPLEALIEALVRAEQINPQGKIDSRKAITLTVPSGTGVGVYATRKYIEVPDDEVWFLSQLELVTPAQAGGIVLTNFRVSSWPDDAATPDTDGQAFWASNQGQAAGGIYLAECYSFAPAFTALGDAIGSPLRLPPGSKVALCAEVTTAALTADRNVTLTPYGWKGKRLVE